MGMVHFFRASKYHKIVPHSMKKMNLAIRPVDQNIVFLFEVRPTFQVVNARFDFSAIPFNVFHTNDGAIKTASALAQRPFNQKAIFLFVAKAERKSENSFLSLCIVCLSRSLIQKKVVIYLKTCLTRTMCL